MDIGRAASVAAVGLALVLIVALLAGVPRGLVPTDGYERATVTVADENGTRLATVAVRVAETQRQRYVGLSETDHLGPNEGMLFLHDRERNLTYTMADTEIALDIVFVGANGTVTGVRHAAPKDEADQLRHSGRGKYVLEVRRGWANRTGVGVGDAVTVPAEYR